jgi:hypothetical protein
MEQHHKASSLIDRNISRGYQENLNSYSDFINSWVDFGATIIELDLKNNKSQDENIIPVLMLRRFLSVLDGISHLVLIGSEEPLKILARSFLEIALNLEFLVGSDSVEKSRALFVYQRFQKMDYYKRNIKGAKENVKNLEKIKEIEGYEEQNDEFQKNSIDFLSGEKYNYYFKRILKSKGKPWFWIYDSSLNNLYELAKTSKKELFHTVFYKDWSNNTHGTNILHGSIAIDKDGEGAGVNELRIPYEVQSVIVGLYPCLTDTYQAYLRLRLPAYLPALFKWKVHNSPIFKKLLERQYILKPRNN